jgi:hypothetical protein
MPLQVLKLLLLLLLLVALVIAAALLLLKSLHGDWPRPARPWLLLLLLPLPVRRLSSANSWCIAKLLLLAVPGRGAVPSLLLPVRQAAHNELLLLLLLLLLVPRAIWPLLSQATAIAVDACTQNSPKSA